MGVSRKQYSCDFETTTKINDCRVWAYGWMEIGNTSNYKIGNSMEEFMNWLSYAKADCYFHNLKFDGSFIINWLMKNGFKYSNTGETNTFDVSISAMGQWYMIDICYGYRGKTKLHTTIYDSYKKLPFTVKKIAIDFKLEVLKGDIDYHKERPIGHVITDEEYSYIKNDIEIIAQALKIQFDSGLTAMTNGSDSLNGFKEIISRKKFEKLFPILDLQIDKDIRLAYRGGFTWLNDDYKEKKIGEGMVFDVNSLYPAVMYNSLLPYGYPIFFDGQYTENNEYPLYIQHVRCEFELKKDKIPTIQIKKMKQLFKGNEYLHDSKGEIVDLYLTNIDWKMIKEHYHVYDVEYVSGWMFRGKIGFFNNFIDYWTEIKTSPDSEPSIVALAKLMLNSLYGKFASNPDVTGKYPELHENGHNIFKMQEETMKDPIYTAMGVFITSYARELTISTAQSCFSRIIYCDTDSIHLTGTELPQSILHLIDPKKLGHWDHESNFKSAKYLRQKTYVQNLYVKKNKNGKYVKATSKDYEEIKFSVKCAGMPDRVKEHVTFDNFKFGFTSEGKLTPKQVDGGVVLVDGPFTLK